MCQKGYARYISKLTINLTLFQFTLVYLLTWKLLNLFRSIKVRIFNLSMEKVNRGTQRTTKTTTIHHLKMCFFSFTSAWPSILLVVLFTLNFTWINSLLHSLYTLLYTHVDIKSVETFASFSRMRCVPLKTSKAQNEKNGAKGKWRKQK